MVKGVAVRLREFIALLDKYGITHKSASYLRKKIKKNKRCSPHMKQYFLNSGVVVRDKKTRRSASTCKGCLCIPRTIVDERFFSFFQKRYYSEHVCIQYYDENKLTK